MKALVEFGQTDLKEAQHIKLGPVNAHQRYDALKGIFNSALGGRGNSWELAKPRSSTSTAGKPVIQFLTQHEGMVPVGQLSSEQKALADAQFADIRRQVLAKHRSGEARDWANKVFDHCVLFTNGQALSVAWGLQFRDEDLYGYLQDEDDPIPGSPPWGGPGVTSPTGPGTSNPGTGGGSGSGSGTSSPGGGEDSTGEGHSLSSEKRGCTNPHAINYDPDATVDDGSCVYRAGWGPGGRIGGGGGGGRGYNPWWWWVLFALLLLFLALLLLGLDGCNGSGNGLSYSPVTGRYEPNPLPGFTPDQPNEMVPIPEDRIIENPETGERIAQGRINVYPKNRTANFTQFLSDLKAALPDSTIPVTDYCNETRRVQLDIGDREPRGFMADLKQTLIQYDLLVWPERILETSQTGARAAAWTGEDWHLKAIHAREAWQQQTGEPHITVAIIDSGFDTDHPDLDQDTVSAYHIGLRNHRVYAGPDILHGTHVAGLAVADAENNSGTAGVAFGCSWMPIQLTEAREDDGFPTSHIVDGILYAMNHGADVINLSLGTHLNPDYLMDENGNASLENYIRNTQDEAEFWNELYKLGERNNCLFVMAAGNDALPLELDPMHRSPLPIYVAATNQNDQIAAEFSNFPTGDLLVGHPGVCVAAPGDEVYSCLADGDMIAFPGTSMASPLVAGAAGLMRSSAPGLSNEDIRSRMYQMRDQVSTAEMQAWEFLDADLIEMTSTTWELDARKENPEQVTVQFRGASQLQCTQCTDNYQRGEWQLNGNQLQFHFEDADGKVTSSLEGQWNGTGFSGTLTMHLGDEQGTFTLQPTSPSAITANWASIPLLDVEELIQSLPSESI